MAEVSGNKLFTAIWSPGASKGTPGTVSADTAMDLPAAFPEIEEIIGGEHNASSSGVHTDIPLVAAVPTATLGSGYVSKVDSNSIKIGDDCTVKDTVILTYRYV